MHCSLIGRSDFCVVEIGGLQVSRGRIGMLMKRQEGV